MQLKDFVTRMRKELGKFGVIGLVAYIIDLTIFNVLRFAGGEGPLYDKPLTAKVVSVLAATTFAYLEIGTGPLKIDLDLPSDVNTHYFLFSMQSA
jgi:hypothetical protein